MSVYLHCVASTTIDIPADVMEDAPKLEMRLALISKQTTQANKLSPMPLSPSDEHAPMHAPLLRTPPTITRTQSSVTTNPGLPIAASKLTFSTCVRYLQSFDPALKDDDEQQSPISPTESLATPTSSTPSSPIIYDHLSKIGRAHV